jgi:antitoxin ParD1/3/4
MGKNTSIVLSDHFAEYARRKVESGEFSSTSEVVREALRRAEERDKRIAALDAALQDGLDSGPGEEFNFDSFLREMHATYKAG